MKLISKLLVFCFLLLIIHESTSVKPLEKYRLIQIFTRLKELISKTHPDQELSKVIDISCVNSLFNLPQNEKMIIHEIDQVVFSFSSLLKCSYDSELAFDKIFDGITRFGSNENINCYKWLLQKVEPWSHLIGSFEISENELEECEDVNRLKKIENTIEEVESLIGSLSVFSCGSVTGVDDYVKFISKANLARHGNASEKVKNDEKENLRKYLEDILVNTTNCIINRFEKDPKVFMENDTLNYYLKKALQSTSPEDIYNEKDYNDGLRNLISNTDVSCTKKKLNFYENRDIPLLKIESAFIIASAMSKCLKIDQFEYSKLFLNFTVESYQKTSTFIYCTKHHLLKMEPTSKLAKISSIDEIFKSDCLFYSIPIDNIYNKMIMEWKKFVGSSNGTCVDVTDEFMQLISFKTILIASEKDKVLKRSEAKDLFAVVTTKLNTIADCILDKAKQNMV